MHSIFTRIVNGEIPCYKVAETDSCLAFLDINPNREGHTLCIPKKQIDQWVDLSDETLKDLVLFSKKVARAIKEVVPCQRVGMSVIGLDVPHVHIHLIPLDKPEDMTFTSKEKVDDFQMKLLCERLQKRYSQLSDE